MDSDGIWRYLWAYAEKLINEKKLAAQSRADSARLGHATRINEILSQPWAKVNEFQNKVGEVRKSRASQKVYEALEQASGKELVKAQSILKYIHMKLKKDHAFDEKATLSD